MEPQDLDPTPAAFAFHASNAEPEAAAYRNPATGFKHLEAAQKRRLLDAGLLPAHILQLWLGEVLEARSSA